MNKNGLMDLELEILRSIPMSGPLTPRAYAVWTSNTGQVEMGPVRARIEWSDGDAQYECSAFPGAWARVPESAMLRVRSLGALSLHTMACVCRGTEYDTVCPAADCKTRQD